MTQEARFYLNITAREYLLYYKGHARKVVATAFDGRRIEFPAHILRPHVTHAGVEGEFVLEYDADNRFVGIRRAGT